MRPILTTPPAMAMPGYTPNTTVPFMPAPGRRPSVTPPRMHPIAIRRARFEGLGLPIRRDRSAMRFAGLGDVTQSAQPPITDTGMRGFLKWVQREYPPEVYQQIAAGIQQQIPQAFSSYMLGGWRKFVRLGSLGDDTTVDTSDAANSTPSSVSWANSISQIIGTATGAYLNVSQQQNQNAVIQAQLQQAQAGRAPLNVSLGSSGITFTQGMTGVGVLVILGLALVAAKAFKAI